MRKYIYIAAAVMLLSGCQKEDLSPKPIEPIETIATEAAETTEAETTVAETENTTEESEEEIASPELKMVDGVLVIPTEFPTFEDGKPHKLYFYADEEGMTADTFTSISNPELGIQSVSFPSRFIEETSKDLQFIGDSKITLTMETGETIYDYASIPDLLPEGSYARLVPAHGIVGIIDCETTIEGTSPTMDEMQKIASNYNLATVDPIFADTSKDGSTVYTVYCATPAPYNAEVDTENINWMGAMSIRFKDGRAQGTYYCFYKKLSQAQKYASYIVQSLRFTD